MQNILVINVNWMGDVVFSSPVFQGLREAYPQARLTCLAVPRVKDILESIPEVDEVIVYDERGRHRSLWGKWSLVNTLARRKFDVGFCLHKSLTRVLMMYFAGVPRRVAYDVKRRGRWLTHKVPPAETPLHRSDEYLEIVRAYGVSVRDKTNRLMIGETGKERVEELLRKNGLSQPQQPFLVFHAGGNWDLKQWPRKYFTELLGRLQAETSWPLVIGGGPNDVPLVEEIIKDLTSRPVVMTGKITLKEMLGLFKMARLVVSADSGPLHVANSLGTDVVGIFGPTRPEVTGPRGSGRKTLLQKDVGCNRQACYHLKCPDNICMKAVSVDDVYEAIRQNCD